MTAADVGPALERLRGDYRLSWREKLGWAFGGFWRSLFASSAILWWVMLPLLLDSSPRLAGACESPLLGAVVNLGPFGLAFAYAYVCASTRYRFDSGGVRIERGWPFPAASIPRERIESVRVVEGMFCRFIRLGLRGGKVRELVLSETMASHVSSGQYV